MKYSLSVGYNGTLDMLTKVLQSSNKVKNVYTGGLKNTISGGRYQYASDLNDLKKQVDYAHDHGASYSVTLNAPCGVHPKSDTNWWDMVRSYIKHIESIGVDAIILSHPFIMEEARKCSKLQVMASTICEISNVRSALFYESFGAQKICPSVSINNNLEELREIKTALKNATLKILVNEYCLGNCPFRRFHQNHLAHAMENGYDMDYAMSCTSVYTKKPYLFLTNNTIRPEDLSEYSGISDEFKLIGRTTDSDQLVKMIKAYDEGKYDGNYLDLIDKDFSQKLYIPNTKLNQLFAHKSKCKHYCNKCSYCKNLYDNITKAG